LFTPKKSEKNAKEDLKSQVKPEGPVIPRKVQMGPTILKKKRIFERSEGILFRSKTQELRKKKSREKINCYLIFLCEN
jgi:hypothetical protein